MKKLIFWMFLGAWLGAMGLAGCGQTGPLYLPKSTQASSSSAATTVKPLAPPTQPLAPPTQSLAKPTKSIAAPSQQTAKP